MLGTLSHEEIVSVLKSNSVGRIGCNDSKKTYVVPVTYAFDGTYIIAHSQPGLKIEIMKQHPDVCFEVDEIGSLSNWKSVILWGTFEEVNDEQEKNDFMRYFINSVLHLAVSETVRFQDLPLKGVHPQPASNSHPGKENHNVIVYRLRIKEMTGRFERH